MVAIINVSNGNGLLRILKQSIRQLIPIEVTDTDDKVTNTDNATIDSPETKDRYVSTTDSSANVYPPRTRRHTAILRKAVRRTWTGQ